MERSPFEERGKSLDFRSCVKKHDHIAPVLKKLHWHPLRERILFSYFYFYFILLLLLLLITCKPSLNGSAPAYINELLYHYTLCRALRCGDSNLLVIPKTKMVTYGERSFSALSLKLSNEPPML